jgi:chromosome segregation ATPase
MKLYDQILTGLRSFFGMAEASESELHQALADAGTIDQIKEKAQANAKAEFETMVNDLNAKVSANTDSVNGLKSEVEQLKTELAETKEALKAKVDELESANQKVASLSGELAEMKVEGASKKQVVKADEGVKTETEKQQNNKSTKVISNDAFLAMFS